MKFIHTTINNLFNELYAISISEKWSKTVETITNSVITAPTVIPERVEIANATLIAPLEDLFNHFVNILVAGVDEFLCRKHGHDFPNTANFSNCMTTCKLKLIDGYINISKVSEFRSNIMELI